MRKGSKRALLGLVMALGMLGGVPAAVMAGGGQPSCGDTLMSNTTLTADLDCSAYDGNALFMGKHRLVLDLNGYTIWGQPGDDDDVGVHSNGYNHTVVKNGTIADYDIGVLASGSYATKFKRITVDAPGESVGIYAVDHASIVVRGSTVTGTTYGIYLVNGAGALVTGNTVTAADGGYGIALLDESKDSITWNTVTASSGVGVQVDDSAGLRITGNTASGSGTGFQVNCNGAGRVTMRDNTATANSYGFYITDCYNGNANVPGPGSVFSGNRAIDNFGDGYTVFNAWNASFTGNVARGNGIDGYYLFGMGGATMTGNIGSRNGSDGFVINGNETASGENLQEFSNNKAKWNGHYGVRADYPVFGSGNVARNNGNANCVNVHCN